LKGYFSASVKNIFSKFERKNMAMDELQFLIERELIAHLDGNYGVLDNIPSVNAPLLNDLQTRPWRDQIEFALGLEEHHESQESPQTCSKSKMPFLSSKMVAFICGANGKEPREVISVLAGVFLIQQASSILDDIQDNDRDSSLDKVLNIPTAMNIALILLSRGQEIITDCLAQSVEQNKTNQLQANYLRLVSELNQAIGAALRGQLLDLQENLVAMPLREITLENYTAKLVLKSSSRFSFLAELGALLGGASESLAYNYRQFGFLAGVALNLMSDLYDFAEGGPDGIEQSRDYRSKVFNLPLLYAYESQGSDEAKREFLQLWEESLTSLETLAAFKEKLRWQSAYEQTLELINYYIDEAEKVLRQLDPAFEKQEHRDLVWLLRQHISAPEEVAAEDCAPLVKA
jgi:geranylgeranyl pyrophosphate synthase